MHREVTAWLDGFSGQLVTTGAVVTEVMYFVCEAQDGPALFAELLASAQVQLVEMLQPSQVVTAASLMKKYADTPMDFADETLVGTAEQLGVLDILTLDRRGFSACRTANGRGFRLVLDA